jgi:hypothetical protein
MCSTTDTTARGPRVRVPCMAKRLKSMQVTCIATDQGGGISVLALHAMACAVCLSSGLGVTTVLPSMHIVGLCGQETLSCTVGKHADPLPVCPAWLARSCCLFGRDTVPCIVGKHTHPFHVCPAWSGSMCSFATEHVVLAVLPRSPASLQLGQQQSCISVACTALCGVSF